MFGGNGGPASTRTRGAFTLAAVVAALVLGLLAPAGTGADDTAELTLREPPTTTSSTTTTTVPPDVDAPVPPPVGLGTLDRARARAELQGAFRRLGLQRAPLPADVTVFAAQVRPGDRVGVAAQSFLANRYAELLAKKAAFRAAGTPGLEQCHLDLTGDLLGEPAYRIPLVCGR